MTQNERLRSMLAEAREWMIDDTCRDCERGGCELRQRIDAALAEPPSPVERENASLDVMWQEMVRECDAARAEVERLKALGALQSADIQRLASLVAQGEADWAALRAEMATAYRRGAEAMREAAADLFQGNKPGLAAIPHWSAFIRALPIPEDKP